MQAIDRAVQHFKGLDIKRIVVEEWPDEDGNPLIIYAKPLTMNEKNSLFRKAKEGDFSILVDCLVLKAMDENGTKLFKPEDRPRLLNHVDSDVVARIAQQIFGSDKVEDAEKNLEETLP